jgi:hypothetical protein
VGEVKGKIMWEYKIINAHSMNSDALNKLGAKRWELVCVRRGYADIEEWYFKRELSMGDLMPEMEVSNMDTSSVK